MITQEKAVLIGERWLAMWNDCSVDEYLTQYRQDAVLISSVALRLFPDSNGKVAEKETLREYWEFVRMKFPNLKFVMDKVSVAENKIIVFYSTHDKLSKAIATLAMDESGLIYKMEVCYI